MPLTRDQALVQLRAWTSNPSRLTHARSVEINALKPHAKELGIGESRA